jgi:hypothetical protein
MSNFKVNGVTPEEGKLKVGSANVKRIYQGNSWVWPSQDDSYTPPALSFPENNFYFLADIAQTDVYEPFASTTAPRDENGFGIFDTSFNQMTPPKPFSPMPTFRQEWYNDDERAYQNRGYALRYASDDYKYLLAEGRERYGDYVWHIREENNFGGFDYTTRERSVDTLILSRDHGQSWSSIFEGNAAPVEEGYRFDGIHNVEMSNNGKIIIICYTIAPIDLASSVEYYPSSSKKKGSITRLGLKVKYIISRNYGNSFSEMTELENYYNSQRNNFLVRSGWRYYRNLEEEPFSQGSFQETRWYGNYKTSGITRGYYGRTVYTKNLPMLQFATSSSGKYICVFEKTPRSQPKYKYNYYVSKFFLSTDFGRSFTYLTDKIFRATNYNFNKFFRSEYFADIEQAKGMAQTESSYRSAYDIYFRQGFTISDVAISGNGKKIIISLSDENSYSPMVQNVSVVSSDYGQTWTAFPIRKSTTGANFNSFYYNNDALLDYSGDNLFLYSGGGSDNKASAGHVISNGWDNEAKYSYYNSQNQNTVTHTSTPPHPKRTYPFFQVFSSDGQYLTLGTGRTYLTAGQSIRQNDHIYSNFFQPKPVGSYGVSSYSGEWLGAPRGGYSPGSPWDYVHPVKIVSL